MSLSLNSALLSQINTAPHQVAWAAALVAALSSSNIRFRCKRDASSTATDPWTTGTEFLNIGMAGPFAYDPETGEITLGALGGTTINNAANLSTGKSVFRIESGSYAINGSFGLAGSGTDLTISTSPTSGGGYGFAGATIKPPSLLPLNANTATIGSTIVAIKFQNTSTSTAITDQTVSFGHVFKRGQLPSLNAAVTLVNGSTTLPAQIDVKATHSDGSVRHAVISAVVPSVAANTTDTYNIVRANPVASAPAAPTDFSGLDSTVTLVSKDDGLTYTASLAPLLSGTYASWLSGNVVSEWLFKAPLKNNGNAHPFLVARFKVQGYKGKGRARVEVVIEHTGFAPGSSTAVPHCVYDITLATPGNTSFVRTGVVHYPYSRYRQMFWYGAAAPTIHIRHDAAYLMATKALPNYSPSLIGAMDANNIATLKNTIGYAGDILKNGVAEPHMPNTGGRPDIGLLPAWDVIYALDQGPDSKYVSLTQGSLMGSWSCHYRDPATDQPISPVDYPNPAAPAQQFSGITAIDTSTATITSAGHKFVPGMGVVIYGVNASYSDGIDRLNYTNFVVGDCTATTFKLTNVDLSKMTYNNGGVVTCFNKNEWDNAHPPASGFMPYLATGEHYHMETIQFYTSRILIGFESGYMHGRQLRAQAWAFRDMAHSAYILPDNERLKAHYAQVLAMNISDYNSKYITDPTANKLGIIVGGSAWSDPDGTGSNIRTWQEDFVTQAFGRVVELGFKAAIPMFTFKAKFVVSRMAYCRMISCPYVFKARNDSNSPVFSTIQDAFAATFPVNYPSQGNNILGQVFESAAMAAQAGPTNQETIGANGMVGYASTGTGYISNMQPALAYAATLGAVGAADAWTKYQARAVKQSDYGVLPEFAIEPRV